jgi:hypothetical protein
VNKYPGHLTQAPTTGDYAAAKKNAAEVLRQCQVGNVLAYIAGGCARDFALGGTPKDIDVVVHGPDRDTQRYVIGELEALGYHVMADYERQLIEGAQYLVDSVSGGQAPVTDGHAIDSASVNVLTDDRWCRVVKLERQGHLPVDILFTPEPRSVTLVIDSFDFNINQYAILRPGNAPLYLGTTPGGTLHQNRSASVSPCRIEHIRNTARKYNWSI